MTTAVRSPVTEYAEAVLRGENIVGKKVLKACQRHMNDLATGDRRGLYFDEDEAQFVIDFFPLLRLPDGNGAGTPFNLLPWEQFVVGSLFGWKRKDTGLRRFRYALVEVARSNGKSPLSGGIGDYGLIADGEQGAQIYSAATTRDQAKIVFNDGVSMAKQSPALWQRLDHTVNNLAYLETQSYFRPLSADASKMDGLRVHIALVDELHEHPDGEVVAKLRTGMKSTQPLLFMISTAGHNKMSVLGEEHDLAERILDGVVENDAYFAYIATIDDDDDWANEACWVKANPSLGVTVRLETLRDECLLAKQMPSKLNDFLRFRLNKWTTNATAWLTDELWQDGDEEPPHDLAGRKCFAGLHVTTEMAAIVLWFPDDARGGDALAEFYIPEDNVDQLERDDGVPYSAWERDGFVKLTEGGVVDYDAIKKRMDEVAELYDLQEIGLHRYNATQLNTDLTSAGFTVAAFSSGFPHMAAPSEELERLLMDGTLRHAGNPVLRWMASNVAVRTDSEGHKRPDQESSGGRIGGMIALLMAIGRALVHIDDDDGPSIYETERLFTI
jgi:phage terminase large subunit-like protein